MHVQRLVSFKFQSLQITVITNHPCYETVILNPNIETELHGITVVLLCDELTVWRDAYVTSWPVPSWPCDDMTAWRDDRVTSWLVASIGPKSLYCTWLHLLCLTPPAEGFPWDDLRKIFSGCQRMAKVPNAVEILPKIWTAWVGRTNVTDRRQTDRRTGDSI